ncbi:venom metalloproteinase antarease TserMP_A-like isoform X2 [Dermacentor andersoni]|uniref:venom metalloproteinase antarease TserMP_A-like isoform X2 n=1 Tax=Dermacentor andersoni TaxID=34620 RepID=UPI0021554C4B|nr:venom metalloproteinase antarease TserMP_A-like isoform X2 [Dermacentor andersoni]
MALCMNMHKLDMLVIMYFLSLFPSTRAEEGFYVYPTLLQERTNDKNLVLRLSSNLTLNLQKSSVLADKLLLVTSTHEGQLLDTVDTSAIQEVLYQDVRHQSSVVLRQREGVVQVEGIINHELRIKPLPQDERSLDGKILHKIYKVQEGHEPTLSQVYQRSRGLNQHNRRNGRNPNAHRSTKDKEEERSMNQEKFTVEIHVISDSVHNKDFKNSEELIAYLAVMTNAVNLRYLDMKNPRVSYILVGITRSKDDSFASHKQGYLLADRTLAALKALKKEGKIPGNYDLLYLLTGQDLGAVIDGKMDRTVRGLAALGAVCSQYAAGEGEDTARTYSGTHTMAHELAHLIGAPHDDGWSNDPECAWTQGYMMSYVDGGVKKYRLSRCSEEKIRTTFKKLKPGCIEVKASQNYLKNHRKFPGQTMREEFYCRAILKHPKGSRGKVIVKKNPYLTKTCKMECCSNAGGFANCRRVIVPAGMACDRGGKTCKRGVCGVHTWEQFK